MLNKFFERYLSKRVLPIWIILLLDVVIIIFSCLLAHVLRYDPWSVFAGSPQPFISTLYVILANALFFRLFRTYANVLRFSSFVDIMRIVVSLTLSYGLLGLSRYLLGMVVFLFQELFLPLQYGKQLLEYAGPYCAAGPDNGVLLDSRY